MPTSISQFLYGAPTWADSISRFSTSRDTILGLQRTTAFRISMCYRTVSREAALALAETPLANLLALERQRIRAGQQDHELTKGRVARFKAEERERTITTWCPLWHVNRFDAPTMKRFILDLRRWLTRPLGVHTNFHLSQMLTGIGVSGSTSIE